MILVVLAIKLRESALWAYNIRPVFASNNIAFSADMAFARTGKSRAATVTAVTAHASIRFIILTLS
jgi:hypothetical protein